MVVVVSGGDGDRDSVMVVAEEEKYVTVVGGGRPGQGGLGEYMRRFLEGKGQTGAGDENSGENGGEPC